MALSSTFRYFAVTLLVVIALAPVHLRRAKTFDRQLLRKFFKCPRCDPYRCPIPTGYPNCQLVLQPGVCACCQVCAKKAGDLCGLTTGRCGEGLSCRPVPGDPDPLGAILNGRAVCV